MSYLVLARKYRPKSFTEMVGQEHVVQALTNALTTQRLHHAYLFTGTRGVGKTTVSRILAKSLNCLGADGQGGITASPCGMCAACSAIDSDRFVDYTEMDAASNRGVDEVQSLLEQAVYKPVQGRFKVFMIDEVHMLTNTAFNAMLKTLEEPPEYLKFVLATTDPQKVPVTVLSRCLQFNLRPMAPETVYEHLQKVLGTEKVQADEAALRLLSRAARGSMRDALSLTDQAIAFGNGALAEQSVRLMLGAVDRSYVFRLIEARASGDGKAVLETADTLRINGLSAASTLEDMASVLQRMAVVQSVPDAYDPTDSDAVEAARLAGLMPADETQLLYSLCIHGRAELGLAPDEYAGLTMTLLRLLAFKPKGFKPANLPNTGSTPEAEKKSLKSPEAQEPPPAPPPRVMPAAVAGPVAASEAVLAATLEKNKPVASVDIAQAASKFVAIPIREQAAPTSKTEQRIEPVVADVLSQVWVQVVQQLVDSEKLVGMARELAIQSQCVGQGAGTGGGHLTLRVEQATLNSDTSLAKLQSVFAELDRTELLRVEVGPVTDSWFKRNQAAVQERQRAAEDIIMGDPDVQGWMRDWGAKIVPGSIKPVDTV